MTDAGVRTAPDAPRMLAGVALIVAFAVAGAGLIVALDHPAAYATRPELTARGDAVFRRAAPPLAASLGAVSASASGVAAAGREASFALRALDAPEVRDRVAAGEAELVAVVLAADGARTSRDALLAEVGTARLSGTSHDSLVLVDAALDGVAALGDEWARTASAAAAAADVVAILQEHDAIVVEATQTALEERYTDALMGLDEARGLLAPLQVAREAQGAPLAPTLDGWIVRATDYDSALRRLYELLGASGGLPTAASQVAAAEVDRAQAALPEDESALIVIATELAEPSLTRGLVGIEAARGSIAEAAVALD